jgi:TolB-like protein/DNA-binding winged helix-turn-helix (wHTH) protein/Tfp pilus assembly protein PilF
MTLDLQSVEKIVFGNFEVNLRTGEVCRNGRRLRLSGQPSQVLVILLQRAGQLVTRDELRVLLWPRETFVDFDHGLNNCINRIRDGLGDSATSPKYIETLPKQGYRFIAEIQAVEEDREVPDGPAATASASQETVAREEPPRRRTLQAAGFSVRSAWIAAVSLFAIAAIVGANHSDIFSRKTRAADVIANVHAVAVLPVTNLSGNSSQEYLTDGITEELITELAKTTTTSVISRTSVMRYKNRQTALPVIARELGVDAMVESSLQRTGNHLKISTHLIAANRDTHLWAESYECEMSEVHQMEARIATDIDARLRGSGAVRPAQRPASRISSEAYEQYLKGQFLWGQWQIEAALRHFQRAAELEPTYAAAYAGIAKSYCRMEYRQILPASEAFPPASAAVEKALELDPQNAEAHAARSFLFAQRDWDWNLAEDELQRAVAADPSNSFVHRWYAYILTQKGRSEDALEQARQSVKVDPAFAEAVGNYAMHLARRGRYVEAIAGFLDAAELAPEDASSHFGLADAYNKTEKFDLAAVELEKAYALSGEKDVAEQFRQRYTSGSYQEAASAALRTHLQRQLQQLKKKSAQHQYVSPSAYVYVYAGLCNKQSTLQWLENAYRADAHVMVELRNERFDFVRREPRFRKIYEDVPFSH